MGVSAARVRHSCAPRPAAVTALLALLAGCGRSVVTEFPPGLEPLEESKAPWPTGTSDDRYPEEIELVGGTSDEYYWAHARAYVKAPLEDLFPVLCTPAVNVDRREVDEWEVEYDVEKGYDCSYAIYNVVHDVVDVEFTITWRHGVTRGEKSDPEQVNSRWQKTEGTTFIELLEGSIEAVIIDDDVAGLAIVEHLDAIQSDESTITSYLRDMYASIVAAAHGEPLPDYDR